MIPLARLYVSIINVCDAETVVYAIYYIFAIIYTVWEEARPSIWNQGPIASLFLDRLGVVGEATVISI